MADILYNDQSDPMNGDAKHFLHVQTVGYSGTYLDLVCPTAANYPLEAPTRYFIYTNWILDASDLGATRPMMIKDVTTATTLSPTLSAPGANEFKISPSTARNRNVIEFHSGQAGHTIACDLYKEGDVFTSSRENSIDAYNTIYRNSAGVETYKSYKMKIIEIGQWNMDTTTNVLVSHGLSDQTKIYAITAKIVSDLAGQPHFSLDLVTMATGVVAGGVAYVSDTAIALYRTNSGSWDEATHSSTAINRGWIYIFYE
jgi:hypothetical protein